MILSQWEQALITLCVALCGTLLTAGCALLYFRHVRLERPAIGTFNGRDVLFIFGIIVAIPVLYLAVPQWALTVFLVITFSASLSIGYRPLFPPAVLWTGIGLLIGASIYVSRNLLGTVSGWQLWWIVNTTLVVLGATAVANLNVQGGMSLRLVAWFGLGIGAYDAIFITHIPLTNLLTEKFLGYPLDPSIGMRIGLYNFAMGIGDLLVFSMFLIACDKAYGARAARVALALILVFGVAAPSLAPLLIDFVDFRTDVVVPAQTFFGPAAFLAYHMMRRRWGRERTMRDYLASREMGRTEPQSATPVPAPEPVTA
jgi:hypothetical protein